MMQQDNCHPLETLKGLSLTTDSEDLPQITRPRHLAPLTPPPRASEAPLDPSTLIASSGSVGSCWSKVSRMA